MSQHRTVAILGASAKEHRYAHRVQKLLMEQGYPVFPISPKGDEILGLQSKKSLKEIAEPIDTVTIYVNPQILDGVLEDLLHKKPRLVIFNPGTESPEHEKRLEENGIHVLEACSLVLLTTGQFEKH